MKKHTALYLKAFSFDISDFIPCEVCGTQAVDIHHIKARGIGGSNNKDTKENLMALCRNCHIKYGDKKQHLDFLLEVHNKICDKSVNV
jgi:5-methylcytosine-specific restriction endonuclease McrA